MSKGHILPLILLSGGALLSGCSPKFVEPPAPETRIGWYEEVVTQHSDYIEPSTRPEVVWGEVSRPILSSDERVRWMKGVDQGRVQRVNERLGDQLLTAGDDSPAGDLVRVTTFSVLDGELTAAGELARDGFRDDGNGRYFVEFLHAGPMDEIGLIQMTNAWNALAASLKEKGLNPQGVVMGGSKYNQKVNAIVMMRVGS